MLPWNVGCPRGTPITGSCRPSKTATAGRGFLWTSLIYKKTDPPGRTQCHKPLPGTLIIRKDQHLSQKRPEVDTTPKHSLSQTIIPPSICPSKGPFFSPKNPLLSPACRPAPLAFLYEGGIQDRILSHLRELLLILPKYLPWMHEGYMLINFLCFCLVNLYFITGVSAKNSEG